MSLYILPVALSLSLLLMRLLLAIDDLIKAIELNQRRVMDCY
jgi:hypothetical protein